jgi:membrane-associated phospholipid phosphatase
MIDSAPFWFLIALAVAVVALRQGALIALALGRQRDFRSVISAVPGGGWIKGWAVRAAERYPSVRNVVRRRVAVGRFSGLPLSLLTVAGAAIVLLAGDVIQSVLHAGDVIEVDGAVQRGLAPLRGAPLIGLFVFLTFYGTVPFMLGTTVLVSLLLAIFQRTNYLIPLWITIGGSTAATWGGKYLVDRPRPEFVTQVIETSPSFPSGHATAAMALYGFLAYLCWREGPTPRLRFECAFWLVMLIGLLGLSRLILGVHYLSDVAVGYLIGLFFLLIGVGQAEWQRGRTRESP